MPERHEALLPMLEAVRGAARICRRVQAERERVAQAQKSDRSPVTVADLAGQALVSSRLAEAFPDVPLVGEEDSTVLRENPALRRAVFERVAVEWPGVDEESMLAAIDRGKGTGGREGRVFTLDPIDGTKGFLRGDHYAVALALIEDGEITVGLLACPRLDGPSGGEGLVLAAVAGHGTLAHDLDDDAPPVGARCSVSGRDDPHQIRLCESVVAAHSAHGRSAEVARRLGVEADPVRVDSQAKYALLALGEAEVYLRIPRNEARRELIWDHAAGALVVQEAGGRVTDLDGVPLDFGHGRTLAANRGILASNGHVHDAVVAALRD